MVSTHSFIFIGGDPPHPLVTSLTTKKSLIVAADSGYGHAQAFGLQPTILVGDMDSISDRDFDDAKARNVEILSFDSHKDFTDTELAISTLHERSIENITIISGGGDRFDHILGMVHSLASMQCTLIIGRARVQYVQTDSHVEVHGHVGDTVSLIPIGGGAVVSTKHLKWNLDNEELLAFSSRGVSNTAIQDVFHIAVFRGCVAVIQPFFLKDSQ